MIFLVAFTFGLVITGVSLFVGFRLGYERGKDYQCKRMLGQLLDFDKTPVYHA